MEKYIDHCAVMYSIKIIFYSRGKVMIMSYEQWQIILGIIDQEVNLSKDNVIEKIKELLKTARILEPKEALRMSEEISHKLETSRKIPEAQEIQEPLKKRLKVLPIPQTLEESKKILKEQNKQKILERVLKRLGVQEAPGKSRAVVLEDVLDAQKTSEKVPVMLDTKKILETIETLKEASKDVYQEWKRSNFNVNHWFTLNHCTHLLQDKYTLLYLSISLDLENVKKTLLEVKAINIDAKSPFSQWNALHLAAENEDEKSVSWLVKSGASVNQPDSYEQTPLYPAAINGNVNIIKTLVKNHADVNQKDIQKSNPLYKAAENNNIEAVECLIGSGAKIQASEQYRRTPLHAAVENGNQKMLMCITEGDKNIDNDIDIADIGGKTALYGAIEKNDISLLEILLCKGADVNLEDDSIGQSPLHVAAKNGNVEAAKLLICYGADVHYKDASGSTAFSYAFINRDVKMINVLIDHGADINIKNVCKILPHIYSSNSFEICNYTMKLAGVYNLHFAARFGDVQNVYALLKSGISVNASDDLEWTPLHYAAINGHKNVIEVLHIYGAGMNPQDTLGLTPLHHAAINGHEKAIKTLISFRASIWVQNKCGERAIDCAENSDIKNILKKAERKEIERVRACGVMIELEEPNTALDTIRRQVTPLTNSIARTQLKRTTKSYEGRVTPLVSDIRRMQLEPSTELYMLEEQISPLPITAMENMCTRIKNNGISYRL